jgi:hypothetical protein
MNYYNINGGTKSRHAEVDSIEKLKPSCKKKKINLLVIRCKKDMTLGNSIQNLVSIVLILFIEILIKKVIN